MEKLNNYNTEKKAEEELAEKHGPDGPESKKVDDERLRAKTMKLMNARKEEGGSESTTENASSGKLFGKEGRDAYIKKLKANHLGVWEKMMEVDTDKERERIANKYVSDYLENHRGEISAETEDEIKGEVYMLQTAANLEKREKRTGEDKKE